ncbi:MAG TPA: type II toxin-antitoxin system RelE/ParE family toxin [Alphaproteobacteria bacterium]|nr:type II toxin-antitoxin system RelE/ParE family toxin [Alphaproteobacteria bacterium]
MRIVWTKLAVDDREQIFDFIGANNVEAALTIDERILEAIENLARFPQMGRLGRVSETRELVISDTPYIAAYQIGEASVLILRILHGAQLWPTDIQA